jgi:hypothetical protein
MFREKKTTKQNKKNFPAIFGGCGWVGWGGGGKEGGNLGKKETVAIGKSKSS